MNKTPEIWGQCSFLSNFNGNEERLLYFVSLELAKTGFLKGMSQK